MSDEVKNPTELGWGRGIDKEEERERDHGLIRTGLCAGREETGSKGTGSPEARAPEVWAPQVQSSALLKDS